MIFRSPYSSAESLRWIYKFVLGPIRSSSAPSFPPFLERYESGPLAQVERVSFLGDIMSLRSNRLRFDHSMIEPLSRSKFILINLEGPVIEHRYFPITSQFHSRKLLDDLVDLRSRLGTAQIIVNLANNHMADFGVAAIDDTVKALEERKLSWLGLAERPTFEADTFSLYASTDWSNRKSERVETSRSQAGRSPDKTRFAFWVRHWGYEFELDARDEQKHSIAEDARGFQAVIGAHSHVPQSIEKFGQDLIVFYSLGNLGCYFPRKLLKHGIHAHFEIGRNPGGEPKLASIQWGWTRSSNRRGETRVFAESTPTKW